MSSKKLRLFAVHVCLSIIFARLRLQNLEGDQLIKKRFDHFTRANFIERTDLLTIHERLDLVEVGETSCLNPGIESNLFVDNGVQEGRVYLANTVLALHHVDVLLCAGKQLDAGPARACLPQVPPKLNLALGLLVKEFWVLREVIHKLQVGWHPRTGFNDEFLHLG